MSHFSEIKALILASYPTATVRLLSNQRKDITAQNTDSFPYVILNDTNQKENSKNNAARLMSNQRFDWLFLFPDEWDNRDSENDSGQIDDATDAIIETAENMANAVFYSWSNSGATKFAGSQEARPRWIIRPSIRKLSSTMSGVSVEIRFIKYENNYCLP